MSPTATKVPFADASPAEIRDALIPEERGLFEAEYAEALREATEEYSLAKLYRVMECWRRIAWSTQDDPDGHRLMLARAEYTEVTRQMAPTDASPGELRELLASR